MLPNDLFRKLRSPAKKTQWTKWEKSVVPCFCKVLVTGEPRLVGLYFRTESVTRCVVRLEWKDGQHWVRDAQDAPWHVHASGSQSSQDWADFFCDKVALEWSCDIFKRELEQRRVA